MKPAPFKYIRAASIDQAIASLAEFGDEAKILAGGQSLVPMMNLRLARPEVLIDINRIDELGAITTDDGLRVGAVVRQADVEASEAAAGVAPLVVEALGHVAHPQLRNRGTVVGSMAHHDPLAELPTVAAALDAQLVLASSRGYRSVEATQFFTGFFSTLTEPDEVVTEVHFPALATGTTTGFSEFARRRGDYAVVAAAVTLRRDETGTITHTTIALAGASDRPVRCRDTEASLIGQTATPELWREAGAHAAQASGVDPPSNREGSSDFRRSLIAGVVRDALARATG